MNNKKDIWKYCQICSFSINNIHNFTHMKEGNFHNKCLEKQKIIDKFNLLLEIWLIIDNKELNINHRNNKILDLINSFIKSE